jgi:hypothetical protein
MGYVPVTVRALKAQGFTVTSQNGGIPTTVIGRDFGALGAMYGRIIVGSMIDTQMPFVQTNATVVTIFAGVNEILTIRSALGGGAGGSDPNEFIDAQVRAFANDYATLRTDPRARLRGSSFSTSPMRSVCPSWPAPRSPTAGCLAKGRWDVENSGQTAGVVYGHRHRHDV